MCCSLPPLSCLQKKDALETVIFLPEMATHTVFAKPTDLESVPHEVPPAVPLKTSCVHAKKNPNQLMPSDNQWSRV